MYLIREFTAFIKELEKVTLRTPSIVCTTYGTKSDGAVKKESVSTTVSQNVSSRKAVQGGSISTNSTKLSLHDTNEENADPQEMRKSEHQHSDGMTFVISPVSSLYFQLHT